MMWRVGVYLLSFHTACYSSFMAPSLRGRVYCLLDHLSLLLFCSSCIAPRHCWVMGHGWSLLCLVSHGGGYDSLLASRIIDHHCPSTISHLQSLCICWKYSSPTTVQGWKPSGEKAGYLPGYIMYIKGKKAHNLVDNPIEQYKSYMNWKTCTLFLSALESFRASMIALEGKA